MRVCLWARRLLAGPVSCVLPAVSSAVRCLRGGSELASLTVIPPPRELHFSPDGAAVRKAEPGASGAGLAGLSERVYHFKARYRSQKKKPARFGRGHVRGVDTSLN